MNSSWYISPPVMILQSTYLSLPACSSSFASSCASQLWQKPDNFHSTSTSDYCDWNELTLRYHTCYCIHSKRDATKHLLLIAVISDVYAKRLYAGQEILTQQASPLLMSSQFTGVKNFANYSNWNECHKCISSHCILISLSWSVIYHPDCTQLLTHHMSCGFYVNVNEFPSN